MIYLARPMVGGTESHYLEFKMLHHYRFYRQYRSTSLHSLQIILMTRGNYEQPYASKSATCMDGKILCNSV